MPLYFESFQFLKEMWYKICKEKEEQLANSDHLIHSSYESEEESAENLEISEASLPLCFESFQFLREMWYNISKEKDDQLVEIYAVPFKPMSNNL